MSLYRTLRKNCLRYGDRIEWKVLPEIKYSGNMVSIYTRFRIHRKFSLINKFLNRILIVNKPWNTTEWGIDIFNKRLLSEYKTYVS